MVLNWWDQTCQEILITFLINTQYKVFHERIKFPCHTLVGIIEEVITATYWKTWSSFRVLSMRRWELGSKTSGAIFMDTHCRRNILSWMRLRIYVSVCWRADSTTHLMWKDSLALVKGGHIIFFTKFTCYILFLVKHTSEAKVITLYKA